MYQFISYVFIFFSVLCIYDLPISLALEFGDYLDNIFGKESKMLLRYFITLLILPAIYLLFLVFLTTLGKLILTLIFVLFVIPSGHSISIKSFNNLISKFNI